jgi:hypothetical protein
MGIRFIYYILVTVVNKDKFLIHGEPTINLYELLEEQGFGENNIIVELDAEYEGSTKILYKWDIKFNTWQMIN